MGDIPTINPEAPRHEGEWYWLMKAEPETRLENGIDVRFSIDDLKEKKEPEGWDGIRAYPGTVLPFLFTNFFSLHLIFPPCSLLFHSG